MIRNSFSFFLGGGRGKWMILLAVFAGAVAVGIWIAESPAERTGAASPRLVQHRGGPSFDLRNATIPVREIRSGGPPKDGIPALTNPLTVPAQAATYLKETDRVAGVAIGDEARAYPLKILNHHEIINDRFGGTPIAVTYCPLCDSVLAFDRRTEDGEREFGVSGLLYNSNVLMYDRGAETESLWSQVAAKGVTGPGAGKALKAVPVEFTTWLDWQARHPQTTVLSDQTGHDRNYQVNPYRRYFASRSLMFPARPTNNRVPAKSLVLGVWVGAKARAYPLSSFGSGEETLDQEIDGKRFTLISDPRNKTVRVVSADPEVEWMYSFWFAWYAFRPHTEVFGNHFSAAGD